jgi:hypothetical protein
MRQNGGSLQEGHPSVQIWSNKTKMSCIEEAQELAL